MAHPKAIWAKLKSAYRKGEGTYPQLSERFGVPEQTIRKRAAKEKWVQERNETGAEAERRAREKDTETLATMLARHRAIANKILKLGLAKIEDAEADGHVSANMLDTMAGILATAARQERLAAGIEPAKPVLAFEAAGAGAVLRVKRRRNPSVPEPEAA